MSKTNTLAAANTKAALEEVTGGIGFYRLPQMREITGLGSTTIWNLSKNDPDFPKPVKLSKQCTGWPKAQTHQWINNRCKVRFHGRGKDAA